LAQLPRVFGGIDTDGCDLDVTLIEIAQVLLETP
jgi:hypothetical protein